MKLIKGSEIPLTICVSYTIISFGVNLYYAFVGVTRSTITNNLAMLLWTSIAVLVLSFHYLLENLPPLLMILIQYIIAMGIVFLTVWITGLFSPVAKGGYFDVFRSFTIPYIIGAAIYYISVFTYAKKQNDILKQIQNAQKIDKE